MDCMHVGFDMDGVLLDTSSDLSWLDRALDETLRTFDIEPTEASRKLLYPTNLRDFDRVAEELGVSPEDLWPVRHRAYVREKNAAIREGEIGPYSDIGELHTLADMASLSIISNSPESVVETFVTEVGLEDVIEHRIGRGKERDAVEAMKPATTFFDRLEAATEASSSVYVGDASSDALFAQRTGMAFIHLDREVGEITSLSSARERIVDLL